MLPRAPNPSLNDLDDSQGASERASLSRPRPRWTSTEAER